MESEKSYDSGLYKTMYQFLMRGIDVIIEDMEAVSKQKDYPYFEEDFRSQLEKLKRLSSTAEEICSQQTKNY